MLQKLKANEYTGQRPAKGKYSEMYPAMSDGHSLAQFVLQQPQVISHMAGVNPQDLSGYVQG